MVQYMSAIYLSRSNDIHSKNTWVRQNLLVYNKTSTVFIKGNIMIKEGGVEKRKGSQ